ncbi:MAG: Kinesin [Piccolia ochrophora]|nr:MAG: Kinesin [Piccolia ochrophora]
MALDPRSFPGVASDLRQLKSSASSPSLRSRESAIVPSRPDTPNGGGGNVRVVVRVRDFLPRERQRGAQCLIEMNPLTQATKLLVPAPSDPANARSNSRRVIDEKNFTFDNSFWSHNTADEHYAHQEDVYNCLGEEFLDHNFEGYHTCIFAYGQTGSGKSYTMMGTPEQPGLIPRTCEDLFQRIDSNTSMNVSYNVRVSYFEVYNEHVRDLLVPRTDPPYYLKIRESPTDGPYVKDLTDVPVKNFAELMRYMRMGDHVSLSQSRTTASTKMNDTSSRSHAVFTIMLKQIQQDLDTDETTERTARIRLVDLAGSERAKATEATGQRLREGSNINKSLTTLGRVIAALADPRHAAGARGASRKTKDVVPFRDSILTWLLKDSLGGNSKTAMIACIAPADYDETLSTLRYADQAKHIRTRAIVNQDHVSAAERDAQIAELQQTIRALQLSVSAAQQQAAAAASASSANNNPTSISTSSTTTTANPRTRDVANERAMEEYQAKVREMQLLMDETRQVGETKIRALQTENEALRRHLKLAVDSLRNPIPEVVVDVRSVGGVPPLPQSSFDPVEDKENATNVRSPLPTDKTVKTVVSSDVKHDDEYEDEDDEDETTVVDDVDADAVEMQARMEELLKDLGLFRRKVRDDHARFGEMGRGKGMGMFGGEDEVVGAGAGRVGTERRGGGGGALREVSVN